MGGQRQFISVLRAFSAYQVLREDLEPEACFANAVINSLPGVFYLLDPEMRFHRWNRNFQEVSGYTDEEIEQLRSTDLFRPVDHERVEAAIGEVFATGQSTLDADLVTTGGGTIPGYEAATCSPFGGEGSWCFPMKPTTKGRGSWPNACAGSWKPMPFRRSEA
ncbi:PAS domain-containing protein [Thiohalorhabdus sp.]|uniref:PAS domain-containing protein n=1 Tax=Thiohalorhabdus sp. TaxID=3094134 RepID=UPI002FC385CF